MHLTPSKIPSLAISQMEMEYVSNRNSLGIWHQLSSKTICQTNKNGSIQHGKNEILRWLTHGPNANTHTHIHSAIIYIFFLAKRKVEIKRSRNQPKSKQEFFSVQRKGDAHFFCGPGRLVEIENGVDYNVNTHKNNRNARTTKSGLQYE